MDYFKKRGTNIVADPVHKYIEFTVPRDPKEKTEEDLIDNQWLQRLKWIHQLQCAIWVFPGAEHSRFGHSLGSMDIASRFAKQLYPSLKKTIKNTPTFPYIEETLRLAALLHDVGHGPFGHFFDHHYLLRRYSITHEDVGNKIVTTRLNEIIENIHRSPSGEFEEKIIPEYLAFLTKKPSRNNKVETYPKWLHLLRPLFSGLYTVDNLDYVMRDSLMCGITMEPIDLERMIYYSSIDQQGLVLHRSGRGALIRFLEARNFLYTHIYFHRTVRSFDLHLSEIFEKTLEKIFDINPLESLDSYLHLTDLSLLGKVADWVKESKVGDKNKVGEHTKLIREWECLLRRRKKWRFVHETREELYEKLPLHRPYISEELEKKIRKRSTIPSKARIKIDMAKYDNRPVNPLTKSDMSVSIYDPNKDKTTPTPLREYLKRIPFKTTICFIFVDQKSNKYDKELIKALEEVVAHVEEEEPTNI